MPTQLQRCRRAGLRPRLTCQRPQTNLYAGDSAVSPSCPASARVVSGRRVAPCTGSGLASWWPRSHCFGPSVADRTALDLADPIHRCGAHLGSICHPICREAISDHATLSTRVSYLSIVGPTARVTHVEVGTGVRRDSRNRRFKRQVACPRVRVRGLGWTDRVGPDGEE